MYPYLTTAERERFIPRTIPNGECIDWIAGHQGVGYGAMWFRGRREGAHRISYIGTHGAIPEGLCVMHTCDRRTCVNPAHLQVGTKGENNGDCKRKGRNNRGERNRSARLTEAQVLWARAQHTAGWSYSQIARALDVHIQTIALLIRREHWRHLP